jgi:hypothetical protein
MQAANEINCLQIYAQAAASNDPARVAEFLLVLPLVYTSSASLHFEEQLVLRLETFASWPSANQVGDARARICVLQLREVSESATHRVNSLQTVIAPSL